ncbi:MAG TPA: SIS domain-containing protein [Tepidisphaeraceae bacterium]
MIRSARDCFHDALAESRALQLDALAGPIERIAAAMIGAWDAGGKILLAGNGGSAADAVHFSEELVARYRRDRRALASIALLDSGVLTCTANDFGYDHVFARQIEALGRPGDVFVGFTTSGNSSNILRALETARARQLVTVAFTGKDGGAARSMCDIPLIVPSATTARIQETHLLAYHAICEHVDSWLLD